GSGGLCEDNGCKTEDCGNCSCDSDFLTLKASVAGWSRTGSQLSVQIAKDVTTFDYCVTDKAMTLRLPNTGTVLSLERVSLVGVPTACTERTPQSCTNHSEQSLDACHMGA